MAMTEIPTMPDRPRRTRELDTNSSAVQFGLGVAGVALAIAFWHVIAVSGVVGQGMVPRPTTVAAQFWQSVSKGEFLNDIGWSTFRVVVGVAVGVTAALPVSFLLAWYRPVRYMFEPLVNFFRALPPIALIPLAIVYLGIGETARISILIYAAFFASVVVLYEGIVAIDEVYIRAGKTLGTSEFELFSKIVVPLVIPQVFVALRISLGVCWATLVAAELIAAQNGIGAVIKDAGNFFRIDTIYMGIATIGILALGMDHLIKLAMGHFVDWQERVER